MKIKFKNDRWQMMRGVLAASASIGKAARKRHECRAPRLRQGEQGIALVITLIMLAVTLVMAVAFLALAKRERASVSTGTDTSVAGLAARTAQSAAQAQIAATFLSGFNGYNSSNVYNFGVLVSTNYINPFGFVPGTGVPDGNPTNVNYDYLYNNGAWTPDERNQNISNLWFLARAPVFVPLGQPATNYDFRFYLDLNENGKFDKSGNIPQIGYTGGYIHTDGTPEGSSLINVLTNFAPGGDPEWVGVLEHPDMPHGPNNHFIARYAFFALPVGNTLDINYIHNQAMNPLLGIPDGFMRNQGVGSWEINLASFFADLNTNVWSPVPLPANLYYSYNEPNGNNNQGYAFQDAYSLLKFRYYTTPFANPLPTAFNVFGNPSVSFVKDGIDNYSRGPLQLSLNVNEDVPTTTPVSTPWSGADNTNHFFTLADFFNTSTPGMAQFVNRLRTADNAVDTYDRYTYYRMLAGLGTDSAPDDGKLNLNYSNAVVRYNADYIVSSIGIINGAETNLMPWSPLNFFLAASDQLLRNYSTYWYNNDRTLNKFYYTNTFGVTTPFSITNIPVWVSNRFVYSPAVNRLLQLAANIYDASTNGSGANYGMPHVYRPLFRHDNNGNVFIVGYAPVTSVPNQFNYQVSVLSLTNVMYLTNAPQVPNKPIAMTPGGFNYVNVYGVPWIIGAKANLPNFNQFYMVDSAQVVRKMQVTRPGFTTDRTKYYTNVMYVASVTNHLGFSFWNSYAQNWPGNYQVVVNGMLQMGMYVTNSTGAILYSSASSFPYNYYLSTNGVWPGSAWAYNIQSPATVTPNPASFIGGTWDCSFLGESVLRYSPVVYFEPYVPNVSAWDTTVKNLPLFPHFILNVTNYVQAYVLDMNANPPNVVDYVELQTPIGTRDIGQEMQDLDYHGPPQTILLWSTNRAGSATPPQGVPWGMNNQLLISLGSAAAPNNTWRDPPYSPGGLTTSEIKYFHDWYFGLPDFGNTATVAQEPYTPARTSYDFTSWVANDPLVHYMGNDLADFDPGKTGVHYVDDPVNPYSAIQPDISLNQLHDRYQPWGRNQQLNRSDLSGTVDPNAYNLNLRDPGMWGSDFWNFPTNHYPSVGWLGRVHRGTPWQTVYLKASDVMRENEQIILNSVTNTINVGSNTWSYWTGNQNYFDYGNSGPTADRMLFDIFTTRFNDNSVRGALPVNQTQLAAWSALFGGMVALSNSIPDGQLQANSPITTTNLIISPAGVVDSTAPPAVWQLVNHTLNGDLGINEARATFTNGDGVVGTFEHAGDILSVPALTEKSPFLNWTNGQQVAGINDQLYEWLPQQMMGLVRGSEPRYVVYCFGQTLKPAPNGMVLGGSYFQLVTNYQVVAESAIRAVIRIDNATTGNPHVVVESSSPVPPF